MAAFLCDDCGKEFTAKRSLTRHKKIILLKISTVIKCDGVYNTKRLLQDHQTRMHSDILYPCEQCKKSFTCKAFLQKHTQRHSTTDKTFECEYCEKSQAHHQNWNTMFFHKELLNLQKTIGRNLLMSSIVNTVKKYSIRRNKNVYMTPVL